MRTVTDTAIDVLEAAGLNVGDTSGDGLTTPYVVLFPLGGQPDTPGLGGDLADAWSQTSVGLQVTCVGQSRQQAQWLADKTVDTVTAPGVFDAWVELEPSPAVSRDDTSGSPALFYGYVRFTVHVWR